MGMSEGCWINCPICGKEFYKHVEYAQHWESYSLWRRLRFFIFHDKNGAGAHAEEKEPHD